MNIHSIYRPISTYFRRSRMEDFAQRFEVTASTRIIDVGGSPFNWTLIDVIPDVTMINVAAGVSDPDAGVIIYDGTTIPFPDNSFDIAYSNSVIEHVGGPEARSNFAAEIKRIAPSYFVQTPNRWFLVEPHFLAPLWHWLPKRIMRRMIRYLSVWGLVVKPSQEQIDAQIASIHLFDHRELAAHFPDATIVRERFLGLVKSLIAVRKANSNTR